MPEGLPSLFRLIGFGGGGGDKHTPLAEQVARLLEMREARLGIAPSAPPPPTATPTPQLPPPIEPPVAQPPPEPFRPSGPAPSGGVSEESIRQQAERAMRDAEIRRSAPPQLPRARGGAIFEGEILRKAGSGVVKGIGKRILGPIGVIWDILTPSTLGSGELTPEQREEAERLGREEAREATRELDRLEEALRKARERAFPAPAPVPQPPLPAQRQPAPTRIPAPLPRPMPAPTPTRAPAPAPQPQPVRSPQPTQRQFPWPQVAQVLSQSLFPTRSSMTVPRLRLQNVTPSSTSTPTSTNSPTGSSPLTTFNPQVLSSSPPRLRTRTRQDQCECKPKPRKKERECRARAPVVWGGGPKKGKPAGTRCISFVKR